MYPGLRLEKPETNCLIHGTVKLILYSLPVIGPEGCPSAYN
jgi:hypothetical protein